MATSENRPVLTRTESDSMGKIEVPSNVYWGAQTQRSLLISTSAGTSCRRS